MRIGWAESFVIIVIICSGIILMAGFLSKEHPIKAELLELEVARLNAKISALEFENTMYVEVIRVYREKTGEGVSINLEDILGKRKEGGGLNDE